VGLESPEEAPDDHEDDTDTDHPGGDVRSKHEDHTESDLLVWVPGPHPGKGNCKNDNHHDDENDQ